MILQFIDGLRGDLHVTFEEGTSAAWLYELLKPHVTNLLVCDPRKNASMREGTVLWIFDRSLPGELARSVATASARFAFACSTNWLPVVNSDSIF